MKGVILAGGLGTRLAPLTDATNKHLLPVGREPMIYHAVHQLCSADIRDILVVTSTDHMGDIVRCLGSGARFGCEFTYRVQEAPRGIAHALSLAGTFARGQRICSILGDNIFEDSIAEHAKAFLRQPNGARVALAKVSDPTRFGVAALDEKQILHIEEKPVNPSSDYAVVGLYFFDQQLFDIIDTIAPSPRGELEITAVNNAYAQLKQLRHGFVTGRWTDAGTFESLTQAHRIAIAFAGSRQGARESE